MFERLILENPEYGSEYAEPEPQKNILCIVNVVDSYGLGMAVILKDRIEHETIGMTTITIVDIRDPFPVQAFDQYIWFNIDHELAINLYYGSSLSTQLVKDIKKKSTKIIYVDEMIHGDEEVVSMIRGCGYTEALMAFHNTNDHDETSEIAAYHSFTGKASDWYYGLCNFRDASRMNFYSGKPQKQYLADMERIKRMSSRITAMNFGGNKVAVFSFMSRNIQMVIRMLKIRKWNYIHRSAGIYGPVITSNMPPQEGQQELVLLQL